MVRTIRDAGPFIVAASALLPPYMLRKSEIDRLTEAVRKAEAELDAAGRLIEDLQDGTASRWAPIGPTIRRAS